MKEQREIKVKYEVKMCFKYQNPSLSKVSGLMSKLDLGIDSLWLDDELSFTTTTKPTKIYINNLKTTLRDKLLKDGYIFKIEKVFVSSNLIKD